MLMISSLYYPEEKYGVREKSGNKNPTVQMKDLEIHRFFSIKDTTT